MSWKPLILCVDDTPSLLEGQNCLHEIGVSAVTTGF